MAVQVERRHHWYPWADQLPQLSQQRALCVVFTLGDKRAVQAQQNLTLQ